MKHYLLLILLILISLPSYTQTTPLVELFFEDAQGRRDTLLVGTSLLACDSLLNTELGEIKIDENLADSISFGVIATKLKQILISGNPYPSDNHIYYPLFSKHNYFYTSPVGNDHIQFLRCGSLHQALVIKCRITNFPLKVSYRKLHPEARDGYRFTLVPVYFQDSIGQSVAVYGHTEADLLINQPLLITKESMTPWPNSTNDYFLSFSLRHIIVGTKDLNQQTIPTIHPFPNPANTHIQLKTNNDLTGSQLQFFNVFGTLLKTQNIQNTQIDINDLPTGVLIGLLYKDGLPTGVFRLVKK